MKIFKGLKRNWKRFREGFNKKQRIVDFQFQVDTCVNPDNGFWEKGHSGWMSDFHFYPVSAGDKIICFNEDYQYCIATYSAEVEDDLIYTYCYQEEENWTKYRNDFDAKKAVSLDTKLEEDGWIRIAVKRTDGAIITEEDLYIVGEVIKLYCQKKVYQRKTYYEPEIKKTIETVNQKKQEGSLVFGLMTDSHYVVNGGWEDSVSNLQAVNAGVKFDAMIHLGDFSDGMVPLSITKEYVRNVMYDFVLLGVPIYSALGNHDSNYFKGNPERMSEEEQSLFYLNRRKPWYYVDFEKQKIRCIFLHSFDYGEQIRYGFPQEEVDWVKELLVQTSVQKKVIIFSHVPILSEMHYWSKEIRNSEQLLQVLEEYVQQGGVILAYIHGHNHADQICYKRSFPIVSIGCAKCEDFKDKKPEGAVTYDRKMGTISQELWDVMVVDADGKNIDFIRFGAGEDRRIKS